MGDVQTTFGRDDGLAELLRIGAGSPEDAKADLLAARVAGPLPLDAAGADKMQAIVGRLRERLMPLHGRPLRDALLDEQTALDDLVTIKEYGKQLAAREDSEVAHAVAVAVYFAAIAAALVSHGKRITSYSYPALVSAFGVLVDKRWMLPELARLFSKAKRICRRHMKR